MSIKLVSLAKEFNLSINTLAEKLQEKGFSDVSANPNYRIAKDGLECLIKEFGNELPATTIEKMRKRVEGVKANEPKKTATLKPTDDKTTSVKSTTKEQAKAPRKEIVTEVPEDLKPSLKIVGSIAKPEREPTPRVESSTAAEPQKEPQKELKEKPTAKAKQEDKAAEAKLEESKVEAKSKEKPAVPKEKGAKVAKSKVEPTKAAEANADINSQQVLKETKAAKPKPEAVQGPANIAVQPEPKESKEPSADVIRAKSDLTENEQPKAKTEKPTTTKAEEKVTEPVPAEKKKSDGVFRPASNMPEPAVKVVGKIDLASINSSTRPARKTREEKAKTRSADGRRQRQRISGQAVDVKAEGAKITDHSRPKQSRPAANRQPNRPNNQGRAAGRGRNARQQTVVNPVVSDEDVQRQVKETLARLTSKKHPGLKGGARHRREKRTTAAARQQDALRLENLESQILKITEFVTVSDLANMMDVPVNDVISTLMSIGLMVSINMRLDAETITLVAEEFGFETEFVSADLVESIQSDEDIEEDPADIVTRPPIVTVMGHVDHGKTSLLDNVRKSNMIAGEAGGITQHIGAYNLTLSSGRHITFLDTPGHEAFTAMRARGAKVTDIAIIIIAADDSVMPQTKEAINHAAAAGVPIVFAINKIDVVGANPEKIREELAQMNYLVEDWGGKYQCQEISAKKGIGIKELLEKVLLEADMLELKANPKRRAMGTVIESSLDKGRGFISTVLVENGTLEIGDVVLAGTSQGRVKAMFNERNQRVKTAGPSDPVLILGLDGAPTAGDVFHVLESEQEARTIATKREQLQREQDDRTRQILTLDVLARRREIGNFQELNMIVKGDVDGSVEALADSLIKLSTEEIQVNVLHKGVGQISESDVALAATSNAIIIGFQVRPSVNARKMADHDGVEIRIYSIIYDAIEDVTKAMEGMLAPEIKEMITANLKVLQVFKIDKVGTIAGCMVEEGKIKRQNKVRLIRDGIVMHTGRLGSLKRFKDDVKEVVAGLDCGLDIEGYNDVQEGDIIEAFEEIEVKKKL